MPGGYLGVDLASRPARPSAYALLGATTPLIGYFHEDHELLDIVTRYRPWTVAIDAPLGLPEGWHCLEHPCTCGACISPDEDRRRACEVALSKSGIACFWTTRRSIIKSMVYRGIRLRASLEQTSNRVLEVFPYATKRRLWGKAIPKKSTREGLLFLENRVRNGIPNLSSEPAFTHDLADALLAAYTAKLHHQGLTEALGGDSEGRIVLPIPGLAKEMRA